MSIEKFSSVDAFLVRDLEEAAVAVGAIRVAPKILQAGAKEMARSLTYRYALLERQVSGASGGINAKPDERHSAIEAFVAEATPLVESGALSLDATGAVPPEMFAPLNAVDHRDDIRLSTVDATRFTDRLTALGAHAAADEALGGVGSMSGARIVIEGFGASGPTLAAAAEAYDAKVIAVSTPKGSVGRAEGFSAPELTAAFGEHGAEFVNHLGDEAQPANRIFGHACDVFYAGSKMGVVSHTAAEFLDAKVLAATGPVPFTTKAFLMLQEKGTVVLPDFLTTAGPTFAEWPTGDPAIEAIEDDATSSIRQLTSTILGSEHGPTMEACYRAESYLRTWRDTLPFGRPFAA